MLSRAIDQGYDDFKWLMKDPDLKKLREDKRFKAIEQKLRSVKTLR